jgi:hypothetical protein
LPGTQTDWVFVIRNDSRDFVLNEFYCELIPLLDRVYGYAIRSSQKSHADCLQFPPVSWALTSDATLPALAHESRVAQDREETNNAMSFKIQGPLLGFFDTDSGKILTLRLIMGECVYNYCFVGEPLNILNYHIIKI